ncbi:hypothetical protein NR798_23585 [Archangium gephyra]|uniref:hypothetical protein n=1 Tax=Archangium gephyra TaxID=48 RepID=UPI0035D44213
MAKCSIQLELDDSESTYAPGELITGTVVVKVLKPCRCEQLALRWQWRARGQGITEPGLAEHLLTLSEREEWLAGQELRYPFRLEAPESPPTYHGRLVSVDWYLQANARVPGFLDSILQVETPFSLVPAETKQPAPATSAPDAWHELELKVPRDAHGNFAFVGVLVLIYILAAFLSQKAPGLFCPLILLGVGGALLYRRRRRAPIWSRAMGNLWFDSAAVAPGTSSGLRLHLRPEKEVPEHDLSISLECVELVTISPEKSFQAFFSAWNTLPNRSTTQEHVVYTEQVLTCTNRALSAGELLEFPHVTFAIPSGAPTSFMLANHGLRWRLRLEVKLKGDKRTFLQLIPFQVQPHLPRHRATEPHYQALQVSNSLPSEPAPWLQDSPPREEERRASPLSSEDVRRQLEGGLEVLEAAHAHYSALEEALQAPKWKLHLRPRLETLREARRQEPALVEALERLHHRARSEAWAGTEPALVLAHEVERLRARVGALASQQLGSPEEREASLARRLEQLERSVVQSLPAPLAPGEKLLCSGRFSPSLFLPVVLLLLGISFTHCAAVRMRGEGATPGAGIWWGAWVLLTALCFWRQYRRSGSFWLTESRLIWLPTRGDPLQVPLHDIRRSGSGGFSDPKSVKVDLVDGQTLQLAFISRSRRFADELKRQCQASHSREPPGDAAPPEPPASAPG